MLISENICLIPDLMECKRTNKSSRHLKIGATLLFPVVNKSMNSGSCAVPIVKIRKTMDRSKIKFRAETYSTDLNYVDK